MVQRRPSDNSVRPHRDRYVVGESGEPLRSLTRPSQAATAVALTRAPGAPTPAPFAPYDHANENDAGSGKARPSTGIT